MAHSHPSTSSSSTSENQSHKGHTFSSEKIDQSHPQQPTAVAATATENPLNAGPTAPMGYPPAMGYPPPYQPYPPNAHHAYNPYGQPLPPQYHPNQHYTYPPPVAGPTGGGGRGGSSFVRGFLTMIIVLILFTCAASIITWLVLRPEIPIFDVENLSVSNFNLTQPEFAAEWDANVTAENPNHKLRVYLEQVQGYVYHGEDFLASSAVHPVFLLTKGRETMAVKMQTNNTAQPLVARWVVDEMARERGGGAVSFNLRMLVLATFKSGSWWTRHASMKVFCEGLRVAFVGAETSGLFINNNDGNKHKKCQVYYA